MNKPVEEIETCALRLLARREHSRVELRRKLLLREFAGELIDQVLDKMQQQGWQDDERFATLYVKSRIEQGDGWLKIQLKLRQRGLTDQLISQVLPKEDNFWQEQLMRKWGKKYLQPTADLKQRAKQLRFLQSRGFTLEQINKVWKNEKLELEVA